MATRADRWLGAAVLGAATLISGSASAAGDDQPRTRVEWFWANVEGGVETADLRRFETNLDTLSVGLFPARGTGPAFGVGAGVRLLFLTLGLRGRVAAIQDQGGGAWQLWTLDPELGIRIPLPIVEPYFTLAAGYASLGNFGHAIQGLENGLDVSGANVRAGIGADVYVTKHFTLGGLATAEALFLTRDGVTIRQVASSEAPGTIDEAKARVLQTSGTSVGGALTFTVLAGLHF